MEKDCLFDVYITELMRWNKAINLVQKNTLPDAFERHIKDSLQLVPFIPKDCSLLADIGSGAGFPGMVLAIACRVPTVLLEPNVKKSTFLSHINNLYGLPASIFSKRWQDSGVSKAQVITSRAFAPLHELLEASFFVSRETKNSTGLFLKGKSWKKELEMAKKQWKFDCEIFPSAIHAEGVIIKIMELEKQ